MNETKSTQRLRLYLVRHGEVEGTGQLFGWTDAPLSSRGLEQSRQLAEGLSAARLSAIYCSDLQRTRLMAEIVGEHHGMKVQPSPAWREIDMGEWEGRTIASLHNETPELVAQLFDDPASFKYPGGESFAAFIVRVQDALEEMLALHGQGEIALVAHGGVCRAIIGSALGMPAQRWLRLAQDYGCLNLIDWHDANPTLQALNLQNAAQAKMISMS